MIDNNIFPANSLHNIIHKCIILWLENKENWTHAYFKFKTTMLYIIILIQVQPCNNPPGDKRQSGCGKRPPGDKLLCLVR